MNQQQLKERLLVEQCSCVIYNQGEVRIFRERGVKDLYRLLKEEPEFLAGASMADKVIGKAAAVLLALGGVREVFALVISLPARELLERAGIATGYSEEVPHIINRTRTGWCPLETRCYSLETPEACLVQIEEFINIMSKK